MEYLLFCVFGLFSCIIFQSYALEPIIIVHGGAGNIDNSRVQGKLDGVRLAARAGYQQLLDGASALDAVEAAVVSMEKDQYFNAGYGSVLNIRGEVEMDASIMSGKDLNVGAVTLVKDFLHPISIARKVLTDSPHALLGGEGAKIFALDKGFETVPQESLITQYAIDSLDDFLSQEDSRTDETKMKYEGGVGTVGAVAIDSYGNIASATSTGGTTGKAVGRIGDVPQMGGGTYADDLIGGVSVTDLYKAQIFCYLRRRALTSATQFNTSAVVNEPSYLGHGESILKYCLAYSIIKLMEQGIDANTATKNAINAMTSRLNNTAGAITLSKNGNVGTYFSSNRMAWALAKSNEIFYGIERDDNFLEPF